MPSIFLNPEVLTVAAATIGITDQAELLANLGVGLNEPVSGVVIARVLTRLPVDLRGAFHVRRGATL